MRFEEYRFEDKDNDRIFVVKFTLDTEQNDKVVSQSVTSTRINGWKTK